MPLDSLEITPGNIDVLGDTDGTGIGSYLLDPGPDGITEYTLTAIKGGDTVMRMVTVTLPAPEITSFTASPSPVAPSENVTLSWQVGLPATTLTIDPGGIDVSGDTDGTGAGSIIVNPTKTSTYTLTATRGTSTSTANAVAIVQTPPQSERPLIRELRWHHRHGFERRPQRAGHDDPRCRCVRDTCRVEQCGCGNDPRGGYPQHLDGRCGFLQPSELGDHDLAGQRDHADGRDPRLERKRCRLQHRFSCSRGGL
ncbi:hypothetical protein OAH03_04245 [Akkermansiaceae bacterium]|nr:hypothetical protein [Akkermansiaceae bacterium]